MRSAIAMTEDELITGIGEMIGGEFDGRPVLTIVAYDGDKRMSITLTPEAVRKLEKSIRKLRKLCPKGL